jgi:TRAP-type C4-dicarboxylate transport system permease small subunit
LAALPDQHFILNIKFNIFKNESVTGPGGNSVSALLLNSGLGTADSLNLLIITRRRFMKSLKNIRSKPFLKAFYKTIDFIIIISLTIIILLTFYNVILRFVFKTGYLWIDDVVTFLMLLMAMLSVALGVKEKTHVCLDSVVSRLPRKIQTVIYLFVNTVVFIFLAVATYSGIWFLTTLGNQKMVILPIPMVVIYSFIPLSYLIATIEHIINCAIDIATNQCQFITIEEQFAADAKSGQ